MKEFHVNHVHFWIGNGKGKIKLDRSENAVNGYSRFAFGREPVTELEKMTVKTKMTIFVMDKVYSNNWRRKHGLKMIKRNRKWQK